MSGDNHGPTLQEWQRFIADHYGHGWLAGKEAGCRCVCHRYPEHGQLQDALEALRWHQEKVAAELCGDCWRKVQPMLHGVAAPRSDPPAHLASGKIGEQMGLSENLIVIPTSELAPSARVQAPTDDLREIRLHTCAFKKDYPTTARMIQACVTRLEAALEAALAHD